MSIAMSIMSMPSFVFVVVFMFTFMCDFAMHISADNFQAMDMDWTQTRTQIRTPPYTPHGQAVDMNIDKILRSPKNYIGTNIQYLFSSNMLDMQGVGGQLNKTDLPIGRSPQFETHEVRMDPSTLLEAISPTMLHSLFGSI